MSSLSKVYILLVKKNSELGEEYNSDRSNDEIKTTEYIKKVDFFAVNLKVKRQEEMEMVESGVGN